MATVLNEILASGMVRDRDGVERGVHSNTSPGQCAFLQQQLGSIDAQRCLEVGLAYGISSLAICEAIAGKPEASFISIDPFQRVHWNDIGLLNLERAGFLPFTEFHDSPSHVVLPQLSTAGTTIDFAYVDTSKIFDVVMVDAFFITRMLRVGGIVVFDDCSWPGVKKLVRYLSMWPHLEVSGVYGRETERPGRRIGAAISKTVPAREKIFRSELLHTDHDLGVSASCVSFKKVAEDQRPWDWSIHP